MKRIPLCPSDVWLVSLPRNSGGRSYISTYTTSTFPAFDPSNTVPLAYNHFTSKSNSSLPPLVILHGLFGNKQNWTALSKSLSVRLERDVFALDLRNHERVRMRRT